MKGFKNPAPEVTYRLRKTADRLKDNPLWQRVLFSGGAFLACLCLSAVSVGGQPLPLAACIIPAVCLLPEGIFAAAGSLLGYFLCWRLRLGLEPMAVTALILVGCGIFRDTPLPNTDWFSPFLCAGLSAAVGFVFLLDMGLTALNVVLYVTRILLCIACPMAYSRLLAQDWHLPEHTPRREAVPPDSGTQLRRISKVFAMLHRELSDIPPVACQSEIADIYDFTAEQVCRCCVLNRTCWEVDAENTYHSLCMAAGPIMQRGSAVREDFPAEFAQRCRHMEGFITAVNQELDANLYRRQLRNRLQEGRRILSNQYLFLSRFLGKMADDVNRPGQISPQFQPDFAVSSACKTGNTISGDRGASFRDRWNNYYVLLCDGMGTGKAAAEESERAVKTLTGLLESGVAPDSAMEILNGFYVLQESSVFATVDLLQVSLATGSGVLYKWGAAPSYLKSGESIKKIGTASPPPGLCVESDHTAEQFKLSLSNGETLVLVSDGAFGEETEKRVAGFRGSTSRELAQYIIAGAEPGSEDDLTAAVLRLRPGSSD